jgi:hypothetical protein
MVTFLDGTQAVARVSLVGGSASFSTSTLDVGTHPILAYYEGDSDFLPTTATASQVVRPIGTSTSLTISPNPAISGQLVTMTATVVPLTAGSAIGGLATFFDSGIAIGMAPIVGGQATIAVALTGADHSHSIWVVDSGDAHSASSQSATITLSLLQATTSASLSIVSGGGSESLQAQVVASSPGGGVPAGSVVFLLDGRAVRIVPLVAGTASVALTAAQKESHSFGMQYLGDANDLASAAASINANGVTILSRKKPAAHVHPRRHPHPRRHR